MRDRTFTIAGVLATIMLTFLVIGWIENNTLLVLLNAAIVLLGVRLFIKIMWDARKRLNRWPVSGLVCLGGLILALSIPYGFGIARRVYDVHHWLDESGEITILARIAAVAMLFAFGRRLERKAVLTDDDRQRLAEHCLHSQPQ